MDGRHATWEAFSGGLIRVCLPVVLNGRPRYEYTATVDLGEDPHWAIIKGFYHKGTSHEDWDLIIAKINEETGRLVKGERQHRPGVWIVQIDPKLTGGRIIMTVNKTPHASTVTGKEEHKKHITAAFELAKAGQVDMELVDVDGVSEVSEPGATVREFVLSNLRVKVSPKAEG